MRRWPDFGLAYVPEDVAQPYLAKGRLKRVLEDWCPPYSGYHLYYRVGASLRPRRAEPALFAHRESRDFLDGFGGGRPATGRYSSIREKR